MSRCKFLWFTSLVICLLASSAVAENWPNCAARITTELLRRAIIHCVGGRKKNIAWSARLPGLGGSTPVVWEDHIIVTAGDNGKNAVLCLNRQGELLWEQKIGEERPGKHRKGSGSNPSPVTDGERAYVYFKSGDLAALDLNDNGHIVWHINVQQLYGEDTLWWDLGTSPIVTDEHVIVACMQSDNSYIAAFDKKTAAEAWKQDRNLPAPVEANQSYSTPVLVNLAGRNVMILLGADHVTAHDAGTGKELWRVGGLNPEQNQYFRSIASPVATGGIVLAPYARGNTLTAIQLGGEGDVTNSHVVWTKAKYSADVPTPAALDGKVYVCTDRGLLACLEAESGNVVWEHQLEKHKSDYSASPIIANGHIYATREDGTTFVLNISSPVEVVAKNSLDEMIVATPVFVDNQILIRTSDSLYGIGK